MKDFIKKLKLALADQDTAEELKKFGIEADNIEGLEDLETPETLDEALKQFNLQSDFDKRIDKALKTREENLKAKYEFVEKEQPKKEEKTDVETDNPAMKAILEQMKEMSEELKNFKQEKQAETLAQKKERAIAALTSKGIPKVYVHEFDFEKDVDEQLETVSEKFQEEFGPLKTEQKSTRIPFPKKPEAKNEPSKEEKEAFKSKI